MSDSHPLEYFDERHCEASVAEIHADVGARVSVVHDATVCHPVSEHLIASIRQVRRRLLLQLR